MIFNQIAQGENMFEIQGACFAEKCKRKWEKNPKANLSQPFYESANLS